MQTFGLISSTHMGNGEQLSSWKEIAAYLKCGVRTVQRWERLEGLPVHRHQHQKNGTVYAYKAELDAWRRNRAALNPAIPVPADAGTSGTATAHDAVPGGEPGTPSVLVEAQPEGSGGGSDQDQDKAKPGLSDVPEEPAQLPLLTSEASARASAAYPQLKRLSRYAIVLLALAAAGSGAAYLVHRNMAVEARPKFTRQMIAVLPFVNLSSDPSQEYFSDGLTEEMITELGRVNPDRLGVIARTSAMKYKHTQEDIAQIGRELGVGYVLEGSVRRDQNRVRVSAQLIQVKDQTHLWAQSYQRDVRNVLGVQQEIATSITGKIVTNLGRAQLAGMPGPQTQDPEAYENYLKGRYFWNLRTSEGFYKAITYFEASVQKDPNYARAYAGLADCYTLLVLYGERAQEVMPRARAAALSSVRLDDSLPEAHTSLAAVAALYDWNWPAAQRDFERAIELDPNYSPAHHWYANLYLIPQGRLEDAIAEMKRAAALDPISLIVTTDLGWSYFVAHQYEKAFEQYSKALEMSPNFVPVHFRLSQYYFQKSLYDQAIEQSEQSMRLDGYEGVDQGNGPNAGRPRLATREDYHKFLRQRLGDLKNGESNMGTSPNHVPLVPDYQGYASFYAQLGQTDEAIRSLRQALAERDPGLIYVGVDPIYAGLHSDPRFQELERQVGLPAK